MSTDPPRWAVAILGGLALVLAGAILIAMAVGLDAERQGLATILGGFGAAATLIGLLLPLLEGGIEIGPHGLKFALRKLDEVSERLDETRERLDRLFLLTMSPSMYDNLRKLVTGRFGRYEMGEGLRRELYHLRDIGYIEVGSIRSIPAGGPELSEFVTATAAGIEFVRLRDTMR